MSVTAYKLNKMPQVNMHNICLYLHIWITFNQKAMCASSGFNKLRKNQYNFSEQCIF